MFKKITCIALLVALGTNLGGCAGTMLGDTTVGRGFQAVTDPMFDRGEPVVELGEPQRELIKNAEPKSVLVQLEGAEPLVVKYQDPTYSGFLSDQGKRMNGQLTSMLRKLEKTDPATAEYTNMAQQAASLRLQICEVESIAASSLSEQMTERLASIDTRAEALGAVAPASLAQKRSDTEALRDWLSSVAYNYRMTLGSPQIHTMNDLTIVSVARHAATAGN